MLTLGDTKPGAAVLAGDRARGASASGMGGLRRYGRLCGARMCWLLNLRRLPSAAAARALRTCAATRQPAGAQALQAPKEGGEEEEGLLLCRAVKNGRRDRRGARYFSGACRARFPALLALLSISGDVAALPLPGASCTCMTALGGISLLPCLPGQAAPPAGACCAACDTFFYRGWRDAGDFEKQLAASSPGGCSFPLSIVHSGAWHLVARFMPICSFRAFSLVAPALLALRCVTVRGAWRHALTAHTHTAALRALQAKDARRRKGDARSAHARCRTLL